MVSIPTSFAEETQAYVPECTIGNYLWSNLKSPNKKGGSRSLSFSFLLYSWTIKDSNYPGMRKQPTGLCGPGSVYLVARKLGEESTHPDCKVVHPIHLQVLRYLQILHFSFIPVRRMEEHGHWGCDKGGGQTLAKPSTLSMLILWIYDTCRR